MKVKVIKLTFSVFAFDLQGWIQNYVHRYSSRTKDSIRLALNEVTAHPLWSIWPCKAKRVDSIDHSHDDKFSLLVGEKKITLKKNEIISVCEKTFRPRHFSARRVRYPVMKRWLSASSILKRRRGLERKQPLSTLRSCLSGCSGMRRSRRNRPRNCNFAWLLRRACNGR